VNEEMDIDEVAEQMGEGMISNVLDQFEGFPDTRTRMRLPPARMRALPKFEIAEIVG